MVVSERYTDEQLHDMAVVVVWAELGGDTRAVKLYLSVSNITGIEPAEVRKRIHTLAGAEDAYVE